jgi:succinate dehydrogenase/fumarate reductase flavoprotein subunit
VTERLESDVCVVGAGPAGHTAAWMRGCSMALFTPGTVAVRPGERAEAEILAA